MAADQGRLAALGAAADLGSLRAAEAAGLAAPIRPALARKERFRTALRPAVPGRSGRVRAGHRHTVVCRCEEVTLAQPGASGRRHQRCERRQELYPGRDGAVPGPELPPPGRRRPGPPRPACSVADVAATTPRPPARPVPIKVAGRRLGPRRRAVRQVSQSMPVEVPVEVSVRRLTGERGTEMGLTGEPESAAEAHGHLRAPGSLCCRRWPTWPRRCPRRTDVA